MNSTNLGPSLEASGLRALTFNKLLAFFNRMIIILFPEGRHTSQLLSKLIQYNWKYNFKYLFLFIRILRE
jgi:hypothetical protein